MHRAFAFGVLMMAAVTGWAGPAVTVYSGGFAYLVETRTVDLVEEGELSLEGLPATLLADSAVFSGLNVTRVEVVRERPPVVSDLIGSTVVVHAHGQRLRGQLLSVDGGLVLSTPDGVVFIRDYERIISPSLTAGVAGEQVALRVHYRDATPGPAEVRLSYLVEGLSWAVTYAAVLGESDLTLQGLASLTNRTGQEFRGASVTLVAGDVARPAPKVAEARGVLALAAFAEFDAAPAFEYHRYAFRVPVDLAEGTAFVPLVAGGIPYVRAYRFAGGPVEVRIRFTNDLGPLPAGEVRVYDEGMFVGAASVGHTPLGEAVDLAVGSAFDLRGERVLETRQRLADNLYRDTVRVVLRSAKDAPTEIEVVESLSGTWTITDATHTFDRLDAQRVQFKVLVPPGERAELRYTVEWRY